MGAIGLNPIRLDRIGLDPIRINAIKLGVPGAASDRPYIDPEVLASLKAVCICYGKSNDDPDRAVVKNLVDPDNPFVISNAAYKGMSGYNGYPNSFNDYTVVSGVTKTESSIKIEKELTGSGWFLYIPANTPVASMKLNIDGIPSNKTIKWATNVEGIGDITLTNGVNEIPAYTSSTRSGIYAIYSDLKDFTITQIPSFEGAFVTDGVDDLITSTKTVQEMLEGSNECTVLGMIRQLTTPNVNNYTNTIRNQAGSTGSYNKIAVSAIDKTGIYGYSFDSSLKCSIINDILGDKQDYSVSTATQVENLSAKYFVQGWISNDNLVKELSSVAWYWTVIANKVLTTDQINQVIAYFNLDRCVEPTVWYDVQKQGLTNETPAADWYLKDFSKNGFDMSLFNFAKKGNSGVGKYEVDFTSWTKLHFTDEVNASSSKIEVTGILTTSSILITTISTPIYNVEIHTPNKSIVVYFQYDDGTGIKRISLVEGINELPSANNSIFVTSDRLNSEGVTITQIPSHAGALCFDGVDDFGINKDVPTFIDFTVIAKRTWLEENTSDKPFIIKGDSLYPDGNQNAFLFEYGKLSTYSFGQNNKYDESVVPSLISYATTYSYNGVVPLVRGSATDTIGIDVAHSTKIALYFLMLFPYSMSEFLIERQLKKHKLGTLYPDMVEFRPVIKSNLPYSSISYSVNPGGYISVGSTVTITVTLPNTSDKLIGVSCNAISDISISGDNGVYEITGKVINSPQKINLVISSYLTMLGNDTLISNETLIKNE